MLDVDFEHHICETFGLDAASFRKLYEEFLSFFSLTLPEYVQSRHLELQREGLKNRDIYAAIMAEVPGLRFAAGPLTERRVRRMIYG